MPVYKHPVKRVKRCSGAKLAEIAEYKRRKALLAAGIPASEILADASPRPLNRIRRPGPSGGD